MPSNLIIWLYSQIKIMTLDIFGMPSTIVKSMLIIIKLLMYNIIPRNQALQEISEAYNESYTNIASKLDKSFLQGNHPASMTVMPVSPYEVSEVINSPIVRKKREQ